MYASNGSSVTQTFRSFKSFTTLLTTSSIYFKRTLTITPIQSISLSLPATTSLLIQTSPSQVQTYLLQQGGVKGKGIRGPAVVTRSAGQKLLPGGEVVGAFGKIFARPPCVKIHKLTIQVYVYIHLEIDNIIYIKFLTDFKKGRVEFFLLGVFRSR